MTVEVVVDSGEEDVRGLPVLVADDVGVEGGGEEADLAAGGASRSTLWTLLSSRLFRLTGVDDLDGVCPSWTCSLPSRSLLVRLLLRSVAGVAATNDEDAAALLDLPWFFFLFFAVEDPGLVVRVILSFFFLLFAFWLGSLVDLSSLLADETTVVAGRGGRLMVTMRAPVRLDRRDDVLDTALATSEDAQCVDERHVLLASSLLPALALAAEVAEADDRPPPRRKKGIGGSC